MNDHPPPTERSRGADPGSTTDTNAAAAKLLVARLAADDTADHPLRRRARAARRLPLLGCGRRDPLVGDDHDRWRDEHDVLMARLGLAPEWQRERARQLWERGVR